MSNNKSLLSSILVDEKENVDINVLVKSLKTKLDFELAEDFTNPTYSKEEREVILEELEKRDKLLINEIINNLNSNYIFSNLSSTKVILSELLHSQKIKFPLRIQMIQTLSNNSKNRNECFNYYIKILQSVIDLDIDYQKQYEVSYTLIFDVYRNILQDIDSPDISNQETILIIQTLGRKILCNVVLNEEFRYKLLQTIYKDTKISDKYKPELITIFLMNNKFSDYRYYIYICQILNNLKQITKKELDYVYNLIPELKLEHNGVADFADFFLSMDDNFGYKEKAQRLLESISFDKNSIKTFYNNAQNIHHINVEESINPFIEKLSEIEDVEIIINSKEYKTIPTIDDDKEYGEFLENLIIEIELKSIKLLFPEESIKRIKSSITRFIFDNTIYSDYCMTLLQILIKSYQYIQMHEFKEELMLRMCEELVDMADTCTTGHIYRIVNIFSGYDIEIRIPIEEEVKSCVFARMQKIIETKTDEEQEKIWENIGSSEEMSQKKKIKINTIKEGSLKENEFINQEELLSKEEDPEVIFYNILGKNITELYDELKKEYVDQKLIDEQTLNIYVRKAITSFQLGEKI